MKNILILLTFLLLQLEAKEIFNPYQNMENFKLDNGLEVMLYSDPKFVQTFINIEVGVGWKVEDWSNYGVAHLVEHLMFRSEKAKNEDYLSQLKEDTKGRGNATTNKDRTNFFAVVNSKHTEKTLSLMNDIVFNRNFLENFIEKEKSAVEIELGEPSINDYIQNFKTYIDDLKPEDKTIYNYRFGYQLKKSIPFFPLFRIRTKKIDSETIDKYIKDYYYPANMKLVVIGNFDKSKIMKILNQKFAKNNYTGTKTTFKLVNKKPSFIYKPVYKEFIGEKNKGVVAFMFVLKNEKQRAVVSSFMEFAAKKLHEELRVEAATSYSVNGYYDSLENSKVTGVQFDSKVEDLEKNQKIIKRKIFDLAKNITDDEITESLLQRKIDLFDREIEPTTIYAFSKIENDSKEIYSIIGKNRYDIYDDVDISEYRGILRNIVQENRLLENITKEYLFFNGDSRVLFYLSALLLLLLNLKWIRLPQKTIKKYIDDQTPHVKIEFDSAWSSVSLLFFSFSVSMFIMFEVTSYISILFFGGEDWIRSFSLEIQLVIYLILLFIIYKQQIRIFNLFKLDTFGLVANEKEVILIGAKGTQIFPMKEIKTISMAEHKGTQDNRKYRISFKDGSEESFKHGLSFRKAKKHLEKFRSFLDTLKN